MSPCSREYSLSTKTKNCNFLSLLYANTKFYFSKLIKVMSLICELNFSDYRWLI